MPGPGIWTRRSCCSSLWTWKNVEVGRLVHSSCALQPYDAAVATTLVTMYGKCGDLDAAITVFNDSLDTCSSSVVLWNSMVSAYARNGRLEQAAALFDGMPTRNVVSWNTMISAFAQNDACSQLGDLGRAQAVHLVADELRYAGADTKVYNAIVNMYGKCGSPELAKAAFEAIVEPNVVSWSALISAYGQNNLGSEALEMFMTMNLEGIRPNIVTVVATADAIASLASPAQDDESAITLSNAVINMKAKCGNLDQAVATFGHLRYTNVVTWNTMVAAYAERGRVDVATFAFRSMVLQGFEVTEACVVSLLTACVHAGTVEQGWLHFTSMVPDFGLEPCIEHYHCMVALLGRVGRANSAVDLVKSMPYVPSSVAITSLLDATKVNGGGSFKVPGVEQDTGACYALLSNLCTGTGPRR